MSIPDSFRLKNCIYLFLSILDDTHILSFLTFFKVPIDEVCQNINKKCKKKLCQKEKFGFFLIFGVNLRHFHLENCNKLFGNPNGQHIFLTLFSVPIYNVRRKFRKKMHKIFEHWKLFFRIFVIFGVNLRHFHLEKRNKFSRKDCWTFSPVLVDPLKHFIPRRLSKI